MTIQLILFEIAIGLTALGVLFALRKSIGNRLCVFASVALAYLTAFLLTSAGVFDSISSVALSLLSSIEGVGEVLSSSNLVNTSIEALVTGLVRPFFMTLSFLLLCIVYRIIVAIVIKIAKLDRFSFFKASKEDKIWKKIVACTIGAVTFFSLLMLSYLPIASIENIAKPAIETARSEKYEGTYAYELATIADEYFLPTGESTAFGKLQKFTGFEAILKGTADALANVSAENDDGTVIEFNSSELLGNVAKCGVNAVILYEYTCRPDEFTMKDAACIADIVDALADSPILLNNALSILTAPKDDPEATEADEENEEQTLTDKLTDTLRSSYAEADVSVLQGDLREISGIIRTVCLDLDDTALRQSKLIPDVIKYLAEKENTDKVVGNLSALTFFEDSINIVTEFGLNYLCTALGISENKDEYYEDYVDDLYAAINEREYGDYFASEVETFIVYAAENDITVSEYKVVDQGNLTEVDIGFKNYAHFKPAIEHFEELFASYLLDDKSALSAYTALDGTVYVYDAETDKWARHTNEAIKASSLASQLLSDRVKEIFKQDIEYTITKDDIKVIGAELIAKLENSETLIISDERRAEACGILKTFLSSEGFSPKDVIYRSDIIESLDYESAFNEEDNGHFASIIATAMNFVNQIYGKESTDFSIYLSNFNLVGRLLDDLQGMNKTSGVPKTMLMAITQHKEYGKYFVTDSIKELTENVKNGVSSYEELFVSVEALYNIVNEIIPAE